MKNLIGELKEKAPKTVLFYLLGIYVLAQFAWWAYMLVQLNAEIYGLKLQLLELNVAALPEQQILKAELDEKLALRIWMVLGEGAVFITMLLIGFWAVRKSIVKELNLAAQQKNFLLSVTHELRSPLAAVKLQLQTLASRDLNEENRRMLYQRALTDTDRLEKLVENLLLVNKVESGKLPEEHVQIDLGDFVQDLLKRYYTELYQSGKIKLQIDDNSSILFDTLPLQSVVFNLVDNALKYGNNTEVVLTIEAAKGKVHLHVADNGPGVPDSEKSKIFERFYRVGNEEVRKTKGTGIGLYLVKLLVERQRGTIHVSDNKPNGAVFTVTLPSVGA